MVARYLGTPYSRSQMSYDLRRLVRKGLLHQIEGTHCYMLTPYGRRVALFLTKVHDRVLRPGLQVLDLHFPSQAPPPLRIAFASVDRAITQLVQEARLAA